MVSVKRNYDSIIFEVNGLDKIFAFKSSLEIPVTHIVTVYAAPDIEMNFLDSIKLLGTSIPHIFRAGTFYQHNEMIFCDVHNTENVIVIELEHEHFKKLVIEVENPAEAIKIIKG
ncbi:MAG: hypothetical protein ABJA35_02415 [Parafilimonas sp.]